MLQSETGRLSRALRSPNIRGQWGELQLRRVLENAGLVEGSHYELKESIQTEEGRLTPDAIVKLPGGKNVVVDAKVPLTRLPRSGRDRRREPARAEDARPRAAGEGSHQQAGEQELLGPLPARSRHRRDVPARRVAADIRAPGGSGAARIQHGPGRDAGEPADADRAAARGRRTAGSRKRSRGTPRKSAISAVSSTIASRSSPNTSTPSAAAWRVRSRPTTARSARWRAACW